MGLLYKTGAVWGSLGGKGGCCRPFRKSTTTLQLCVVVNFRAISCIFLFVPLFILVMLLCLLLLCVELRDDDARCASKQRSTSNTHYGQVLLHYRKDQLQRTLVDLAAFQ